MKEFLQKSESALIKCRNILNLETNASCERIGRKQNAVIYHLHEQVRHLTLKIVKISII